MDSGNGNTSGGAVTIEGGDGSTALGGSIAITLGMDGHGYELRKCGGIDQQ